MRKLGEVGANFFAISNFEMLIAVFSFYNEKPVFGYGHVHVHVHGKKGDT